MNIHNTVQEVLNDIKHFDKKKFIIVTGGIGDFFSIDYFFSYSYTKNIIFISSQSLKLRNIFNFYTKKNKKFYSLYFDFSLIGKPGFENNRELSVFFPQFKDIKKVNIVEHFPLIKKLINSKKIINNSIIFNSISNDVKEKFNIPEKYAIINPFTEDNRVDCIHCNFTHIGINKCGLTRNFIHTDYINVFKFLQEKNITGVIISIKPIHLKEKFKNINIINLSLRKLYIIDCIELVKKCNYFFGIDSFFSVIASKILPSNNIYVKCNNSNGYNNKDIYWYPNKNINLQRFITPLFSEDNLVNNNTNVSSICIDEEIQECASLSNDDNTSTVIDIDFGIIGPILA